ncbi:MAG: type VI secretion system contractile sheath large subunit [Methylomonas sp.]|uniref:type VI secretion system contractile sheath domain-containing protein n=1 Tax=Methylomonas sp. TaxID=418 RepID=UPI0025D8318C|nr:type VI secretion system contractile sheath large subunit [Methylomonas sp.]MCK9607381.1 type VI secretion system contractile sheath large subunit [Methylomonas sp.]
MSGRIDFSIDFNKPGGAQTRQQAQAYRFYILGDFSGVSDKPWEQRKMRAIDNDSFDQVMADIQPVFQLDSHLQLHFEAMEDFHPDAWLDKVKLIADLRVLKQQLSNPVTAAQAAAKIQAFFPSEQANVEPDAVTESQDDMLERLLGKKTEKTDDETDTVERLLKQMVTPFVTKNTEPQYQHWLDVIDAAISQCLRAVLRSPNFQGLEALWRATQMLVNEEFADGHGFYLLDISQAELRMEQKNGSSALAGKLLQHIQKEDGEQEVMLIGHFRFSDSSEDTELLSYCGSLAQQCGGYFLTDADQGFIQQTLNAEPAARINFSAERLLLAYPRYLLRLPYGQKRDPIDAFEFEECSAIPGADELLWGCASMILARGLIRTSQEYTTSEVLFFSEIPAFSFEAEGEPVLQPATEAVLTEAQANELFTLGIMPLISYRQRRGVSLLGLIPLS